MEARGPVLDWVGDSTPLEPISRYGKQLTGPSDVIGSVVKRTAENNETRYTPVASVFVIKKNPVFRNGTRNKGASRGVLVSRSTRSDRVLPAPVHRDR